MSTRINIAIDGPAASGKSAVGQALAERLGYRFLDTGAMYRAVTWFALRRDVDVRDEAALAELIGSIHLDVSSGGESTSVLVNGDDATPHLRDPDVEANVSLVSQVPVVRDALVRIQRDLARSGSIVMAGRDIGTVVLPDAPLKIYLDASPEVRATRRAAQLDQSDDPADKDALANGIAARDRIDSSRATSPLTAAPDAVIIDTDELSLGEVVRKIEALARG